MGKGAWIGLSYLVGYEARNVSLKFFIDPNVAQVMGSGHVLITSMNFSVLTQPRQLQAVFKDSDKHSKAPANNSGFYMGQLLGQCVGLISGREWRAVRALTETPFGHAAVAVQIEIFQSHITEHFQSLHSTQGGGNLSQGLLHPVDDLTMLPFRIVADMFYGSMPLGLRKQLEDLVPLRTRIFNEHVIRGGIHRFAWARFLPTAANDELALFKRAWKAFNQNALAHAREAVGKGPPPPVVDMFDAVAAGKVSEEQLLQTLDESLFANLDVTIGGLSWVPVFLAAHPDAQQRLRDEILAATTAEGLTLPEGQDQLHRYLLDSRSTYLASCVIESSRLRPLAAFSVPQAAPTPRRVDVGKFGLGYTIPEGTSFVVDAYALNVRNEAWAPDNEAFRPDRFLDSTDKDARDRRYLFWRFGFGPRQCMGRHAADLIIRMVVAHLVQNYNLDMLRGDETAWARSRDSWITHPDFKIQCVKRREERAGDE